MSGSIDPQVTQVPLTEDQRSQIHVNRVRALLIRHSQASGQGFPQSLIENNPPPSTTPPRPPTPEPITNTSSTDAVDPPTEEQTGNEQTNAPSAKKSRRKPKCSLCKSEGHTRNYHKDEEQYAEFFKTLEEKKKNAPPKQKPKDDHERRYKKSNVPFLREGWKVPDGAKCIVFDLECSGLYHGSGDRILEICLFVMMIAALGRCGFRVFMKDKPIKRGFKLWAICCAVSRYCCHLDLYCGLRKRDEPLDIHEQIGKNGQVVLECLRNAGLLDMGHHIVMDRAFTNIPLFRFLRQWHRTTCTGTLNANRKGVDVSNLPLLGDRGYFINGSVTLTQSSSNQACSRVVMNVGNWQDSKPVLFLSTECPMGHELGDMITKRNTKASGASQVHTDPYFEPLVRNVYNMCMGGVDGNDQLRSFFDIRLRRMKKWPMHIFVGTLSILLVNSFIHYNDWQASNKKAPCTTHMFRRDLIGQIIQRHCYQINFPLRQLFNSVDNQRKSKNLKLIRDAHDQVCTYTYA